METRIALFQKKEIRKTLHADEWWFVIVDVVAALTDSTNPAESLKKMRLRDEPLSEALKGGNLPPLALEIPTASGPQKLTCWHTEGIFRLIQSIPSPKAEPFKRWLARVGYEREQEIENPELAPNRPAKAETPATAPSLMSLRRVMAPSEPCPARKPSHPRPAVAHRDGRLHIPALTPLHLSLRLSGA